VEKYGPPAAVHAAKMLPKLIEDAALADRAQKILNASATTLPGAGFLQISAEGVCRLYFIDDRNSTIAVNAASLPVMLALPNLRDRKTLIVDELSGQAYRTQLESVRSQFDLWTASGIRPVERMTRDISADRSEPPLTKPASGQAAGITKEWTATDLVVYALNTTVLLCFLGLAVLLSLFCRSRLYREFLKLYRGDT